MSARTRFAWPPAFPIAPIDGREPAPPPDLYDEVFTCVAHAIAILAKSKASPQVLLDYLPSSRGDFVAAASETEIAFFFRSPAGMCEMAAEAATHWAELSFLALRPQIDEVLAGAGYLLVDPPTLEVVLARGPRCPMIELGAMPYCVVRRDDEDAAPEIFTDQIPDPLRYDTLTPAQRKRVAALADGGPCECTLCKRLRKTPVPAIDLRKLRARDAASADASNLGAALRRRDVVRSLVLAEKGLTTLPPEIGKLTRLEHLDVSSNALTELPVEIGALQSLRVLNLYNNRLHALPDAMAGLTHLERLNLSNNPWDALPAWLPELPSLKHLELVFFRETFEPFPSAVLRSMKRLESLSMQGVSPEWARQLEAFPWDALPALRSLSLRFCKLGVVPEALTRCADLERLDLTDGTIRELPPAITDLARLRSLAVGRHALTALPEAIGRLGALEELVVAETPLASLPASLCELRALKMLVLVRTALTHLPERFGDLACLETLNLSETKLVALPASFGRLPRLRTLYFYVPNAQEMLAAHRATLPPGLVINA